MTRLNDDAIERISRAATGGDRARSARDASRAGGARHAEMVARGVLCACARAARTCGRARGRGGGELGG